MATKLAYRVITPNEGGMDDSSHENIRDVVLRYSLTDPEIVELAKLELGETMYVNGSQSEVFALKPEKR